MCGVQRSLRSLSGYFGGQNLDLPQDLPGCAGCLELFGLGSGRRRAGDNLSSNGPQVGSQYLLNE